MNLEALKEGAEWMRANKIPFPLTSRMHPPLREALRAKFQKEVLQTEFALSAADLAAPLRAVSEKEQARRSEFYADHGFVFDEKEPG